MTKYNRIITLVLDSVGIGQMPDAPEYGDFGVNTLGNISEKVGLDVPNLQEMGLGNINYLKTVLPAKNPTANFGKMAEIGDGKDTMTGHWEMMGATVHTGFQQFIANGFPQELIEEFEKRTNRKVIANKEANGMAVINEYFEEHMQTGAWIVYTSVDSTFQIAAHEEKIPLEELYAACEIARELTKDPKYNVARVIARPFLGTHEDYYRTANRHDYALDPHKPTVLNQLEDAGLDSVGVGKISDIFNGHGITEHVKSKSNMDGVDNTIALLKRDDIKGHIFVNLVDFDSMYGHPRNVEGYKECLEAFDARVPEILGALKDDDLLIITADHGNDPTYKGNDHTREYVPLLVYGNKLVGNNHIPTRMCFEDLGQTICENFDLKGTDEGTSFLNDIK